MKPLYNHKEWVLCRCATCGQLNYVEPHGTTAKCRCSEEWAEHNALSQEEVDSTRRYFIGSKNLRHNRSQKVTP